MNENQSIKTTLLHFFRYFISNIFTKALAFISIPIYTHLLMPAEYGVFSVFIGYLGLFATIATWNTESAVSQYMLKYGDEKNFRSFFFSNTVLTYSIVSLTLLVSLFFIGDIAALIKLPSNLVYLFIPLIVYAPVFSYFEQISQAKYESKKLALRNILYSSSLLIVSIVLIIALKENRFLGIPLSYTMVGFCFFIFYCVDLRKHLVFKFDFSAIKYIFAFTLPLLPYMLSGVILAQANRMMINLFSGAESAGRYSFASNIGMLEMIFFMSMLSAFHPQYYRYMKESNTERIDSANSLIFTTSIVFACFLVLFSKEIGMILSPSSYHLSLGVVPLIVLGYIFYAIFYIWSRNFQFFERTWFISLTVFVSGFVNIGFNLLFIREYGNWAAGFSTVISYFFMACLCWIGNKFLLKAHGTSLKILFKPFVLFCGVIGLYYLLYFLKLNFYLDILIKGLVSVCVAGLLFWTKKTEILAMLKSK